jgi:hypothetical protein
MATVNRTVRETAAKMTAPKVTAPKAGTATRISVQKAKGGYISETEYKNTHEGPHYNPPEKAVHKTLSSVKQHMAHGFNVDDAEEA